MDAVETDNTPITNMSMGENGDCFDFIIRNLVYKQFLSQENMVGSINTIIPSILDRISIKNYRDQFPIMKVYCKN